MGDKTLVIQHMGKRLVQFKLFLTDERLQGRRRAPSSLETASMVQNYLLTHNAVLQSPAARNSA